ncbi:hypothetical protein BGZ75_008779 [Mortierella antarctica]|nr:hypothetical protein BGZ75_008779 [Mortierella antarctica]
MAPKLKGFGSHGIREPLTNRIAGILDEYPDGTQIARELLQNSDDARSTVQWYLLDHRNHLHYPSSPGQGTKNTLKLFHEDLEEYMGPALLAGNDSLFEEKDFLSMKNLAASEKRADVTKIGQMGIGFNSIYHLTDCPSFISGEQFMVIEPHERIFNGAHSEFTEGAVKGNYVEEGQGLEHFPDQLKPFAVVEDIDFSKPYPGTVFRFPLRTKAQAETSRLSPYAYPAEKASELDVLEMLLKLKQEALKGLLFLKHLERIVIYERKEMDDAPVKLFEIEILNAKEVREERLRVVSKLKDHIHPTDPDNASKDATLQYTVCPTFRLTEDDGSTVDEQWQITGLVGNVLQAKEEMQEQTDGDLANHKLIPWVGIAAPLDPNATIDNSGLFCFLPISIRLPFPVHINGHFAVKHSRREIWTNQDKDFGSQASANIKSLWNVHLFRKHIPEVYAMFLERLGLNRGSNYDMWPLSCGDGVGLESIWRDILDCLVEVVLAEDRCVFFCGTKERGDQRLVPFSLSWIAGRDMDDFPLLMDILHDVTNLVAGLPDAILDVIPEVLDTFEMENRVLTPAAVRDLLRDHKDEWLLTTTADARMQILNYCIQDKEFEDLEGLPLLPLVGDLWVEFSKERASERHLLPDTQFTVLKYSPEGIVDISVGGLPLMAFKDQRFNVFWSAIRYSQAATRVMDMFHRLCYKGKDVPRGCITQSEDDFPSDDWLADFWKMSKTISTPNELLKRLAGYHLLPISECQIAPLSTESNVISNWDNRGTEALETFSMVLSDLGCRLLRDLDIFPKEILSQYLVELSEASKILTILCKQQAECLHSMPQEQCRTVSQYMAEWLPHDAALGQEQLRVMRALPIYLDYREAAYVSLEEYGDNTDLLHVAHKFSHAEKPWLPSSIRLLADGQRMLKHLVGLLDIPVMKESEYWFQVMSHLAGYAKDDWDNIMAAFCAGYHIHGKDYSFKTVLSDVAFVRVKGPRSDTIGDSLIAPRSTVDPSLSGFFLANEIVFPGGVYATVPISTVLPALGMQTAFDTEFVAERIRVLSKSDLVDEIEQRNSALLALYKRLDADCTQELLSPSLQNVLRTVPWIRTKTTTDAEAHLCTPSHCRPWAERHLLGSQLPLSTFSFTNTALLKCMGWSSPPPLDKVLANLVSIIEQATLGKSTDGRPAVDDMVILAIYRYLLEQVSDPAALLAAKAALQLRPWILINGTLHTADRVALKMTCDLSPHYLQITPSKMDDLFLAMGVREHVRQEDLQEIIETVASKYSEDESLSNVDVELVVKLLDSIANGPLFQWSPELLVLTEHSQLRKITGVVFDDAQARKSLSEGWEAESTEMPYTFVSDRISRFVAERLQINMLSAQCWQMDSTFETWAQQEDIIDRIRNVLNDYDPSSILTEFLQNAADAGATKCVFMLDYKSYGTEKVLSKEMAAWQGPALMIYNNAEFSQDDFRALSQIGVGNKREDSSKIGRHGLGFNSAYHFGDVPSVCSGSYIGFFDPLLTNLPKIRTANGLVAQGGQRCDFRKLKQDALSDQLAPYQDAFGCNMKSRFKGTIFRIPLRTLDSQLRAKSASRISDHVWDIKQMQDLLKSWFEDAKLSMLFLDGMEEVQILASEAFTWSASKRSVAREFGMERSLVRQEDSMALTDIIRIEVVTAKVEAGRVDSASSSRSSQDWLLQVEEGFPLYSPAAVKALAEKHHWSTHRGVAFPLCKKLLNPTAVQGRLFAHLPTPILTQLHFHVHGMFALMSNRKSLAGGSEEGNPMTLWNNFVLEECLPLTAVNACANLLRWYFRSPEHNGPAKPADLEYAIKLYFEYMPRTAHKSMECFTQNFWKHAHQNPIFPCRTNNKLTPVVGLKGAAAIFPSSSSMPDDLELRMQEWIRSLDILYCNCPRIVLAQMLPATKANFGYVVQQINEDMVRRLIKKDPSFIRQKIKTEASKQWILEYVLKAILDKSPPLEPISGLTILPLVNGEWKQLLPSPVYYTASSEMRSFINGGDMLVDETLFSTDTLQKILTKMATDDNYGVKRLPSSVFAEAYEKEHPQGVSPESWEKLWIFLEQFPNLELFEDMSILKTADGTTCPLSNFRHALRISSAFPDGEVCVQNLRSLLADLGIIVFDARLHRNHPYLINNVPACDPCRVLTVLSYCISSWPTSRAITNNEAEVLRGTLYDLQGCVMDKQVVHDLGHLKIWNSYKPRPKAGGHRPLIPAQGSVFIVGNYDLSNLGDHEDVISDPYFSRFEALGANPLSLMVATEFRIVPKILQGTLNFSAETRAAYTRLLSNIIDIAVRGTKKANREAKKFIKQGRIILCRDRTLRSSAELFDVDDQLLMLVFHNATAKFADTATWNIIRPVKNLFAFRKASDQNVVRECAEEVLREIRAQASTEVSGQALPMVRSKASALVQYIYDHPEGIDWMEPKWSLVPADVGSTLPHSSHAPKLPKYLPFSKLVFPSYRDAVWTQCAFFPESLQPSAGFMRRFNSVGKPAVQDIVQHLTVLVRDLAPQWTSMDRQLALKLSVFKVYETLQEMSSRSTQWKDYVRGFLNSMPVPYILNGDKDSDKPDSWLWPTQLMLDIDNDIERHRVVHPKLLPYREFLVAAGVDQMQAVEGFVAVPVGRGVGELEKRLLDCFEEQNRYTGFMDVRFKFADGQEIQAHKFILVHSSDHFKRRFTGLWADYTTREEEEPGVEVINLTSLDETYEAFWGLVYYFYSDRLIATNGPVRGSNDGTLALESGQVREEQAYTDELRDRVQYLMALQHLADLYVMPRLKSLIASEIVVGKKVIHSNVFSVRDYAIQNQCKDLQDHCEKYIQKNRSGVRKYIEGDLIDFRRQLNELSEEDHGAERADLREDIAVSERNLEELDALT